MKTNVIKQREDGTLDFTDSLVVQHHSIPKGYVLPDRSKHYKDDGTVMTDKEIEKIINAPKPTPVEQKLGQQLVEKDLQIMKLEKNNHDLGEQVVDHDIRIMKGGL